MLRYTPLVFVLSLVAACGVAIAASTLTYLTPNSLNWVAGTEIRTKPVLRSSA
jgi:hypothetical protein